MLFEWDETKAAFNWKKHGVSFEEAREIFFSPYMALPDLRSDYGETRLNAIGLCHDKILHITYTMRNGRIRLISARKASRLEKEHYTEILKIND